ncbi:MAG: ATP-binding protein [Actinobacteria bacterium]|nr:ATP-binding protein [Actinomycetota bacterium]MCL6087351.1 ATP-binding protein [Actinomycetota bacterium]
MTEEEIIKKHEDILRRYNILNIISKIVASTNELDKILRIMLKGVTFGDGFGFNRAFLFLADKKLHNLKGKLAIGTETAQEAWKIWAEIQQKNYSLEEFITTDKLIGEEDSILNKKLKNLIIPVRHGKIIEKCLIDGNPVNVNLSSDYSSLDINNFSDVSFIENELLELINYPKFCLIPLISRTKKVGILIVDNKYNSREITQEDITFLMMLGQFAASSIRNTIIYTELKQSLNNLGKVNYRIKLLKEYNENIIESVPLSMFVVNNDFIITACNKNFSDIMNLSKKNLIGKNIRNMNIKVNDFNLVEEIENVMTEKKFEGFYKVKMGMNNVISESIFDLLLVVLKDSKNNIDGVIGIIEDVTKTANLEKFLQETNRFSELGKISATVAHEIRNPLISIGGYANRIKRKYEEEKEFNIDDVDVILNEIKRLESILNDILDYASDKKVEFKIINLCSVLKECLELAEASAEQNNINIDLSSVKDFLNNNNLNLNGSYDNLKQAFINLLNNAIEASTAKQTVRIDSKIIREFEQDWIEIKINNQAAIQNKNDLYNIFLPFYTTKTHGTGLGLTITKKIIEEHSGKINVESNLENGTTFIIKLPLIQINDNALIH